MEKDKRFAALRVSDEQLRSTFNSHHEHLLDEASHSLLILTCDNEVLALVAGRDGRVCVCVCVCDCIWIALDRFVHFCVCV